MHYGLELKTMQVRPSDRSNLNLEIQTFGITASAASALYRTHQSLCRWRLKWRNSLGNDKFDDPGDHEQFGLHYSIWKIIKKVISERRDSLNEITGQGL